MEIFSGAYAESVRKEAENPLKRTLFTVFVPLYGKETKFAIKAVSGCLLYTGMPGGVSPDMFRGFGEAAASDCPSLHFFH